MLSLFKMVNVNEGIYYDKDVRIVLDKDLIGRFTSPEFVSKCFDMCDLLQSFNLSVLEQALLKAVAYLCPGN